MNVDMELADIDRSHRVGRPGQGKQRDIIVKIVSYRMRRKLYGVRVQTKSNGLKGVFINEDLTRVRSRIQYGIHLYIVSSLPSIDPF